MPRIRPQVSQTGKRSRFARVGLAVGDQPLAAGGMIPAGANFVTGRGSTPGVSGGSAIPAHSHIHGAMLDLDQDDHTQYLLADGTRGLSADWDAGAQDIKAASFSVGANKLDTEFAYLAGIGAYVYRAGGTDVPLADGGTGASLADPNDDRLMAWDDSAGAVVFADFGNSIAMDASAIIDTIQDIRTSASPQFAGVNIGHASDTTITRSAAGIIAVEGKDAYLVGGADVALADGGTGASLSDPGANVLMGWDDTDNAVKFITLGANLSYDHASHTLSATGGGGAHAILSATHSDTLADSVLKGDVLIGNATPKWSRLAVGTDGQVLTAQADGTVAWENAAAVGGYTNLTQFVAQTAWRLFYSNTDGDVVELAFGDAGKVFTTNGAAAAPTWETPTAVQVHIEATASPGVNDDVDLYALGTEWIEEDSKTAWFCVDNTNGAAVWYGINQSLRTYDTPEFDSLLLRPGAYDSIAEDIAGYSVWGGVTSNRGSAVVSAPFAGAGAAIRRVMFGNNLRYDLSVVGGTHAEYQKQNNAIGAAGLAIGGPNAASGFFEFYVANDSDDDTWAVTRLVLLNTTGLAPGTDSTYSLGSASLCWADGFFDALTMTAGSIATDTTTGLKIGTGSTQKVGFFGATPVIRQAHLADPAANIAALAEWAANVNLYLERFGLVATS